MFFKSFRIKPLFFMKGDNLKYIVLGFKFDITTSWPKASFMDSTMRGMILLIKWVFPLISYDRTSAVVGSMREILSTTSAKMESAVISNSHKSIMPSCEFFGKAFENIYEDILSQASKIAISTSSFVMDSRRFK